MNFCPESQTPELLPEGLAFYVQSNAKRPQKRKITKKYPSLVDNMLLLLRLFIFCGNHFWERGWNVSCEFARSCFSLKRLRSALQSICSGQQSKNSIICFGNIIFPPSHNFSQNDFTWMNPPCKRWYQRLGLIASIAHAPMHFWACNLWGWNIIWDSQFAPQ